MKIKAIGVGGLKVITSDNRGVILKINHVEEHELPAEVVQLTDAEIQAHALAALAVFARPFGWNEEWQQIVVLDESDEGEAKIPYVVEVQNFDYNTETPLDSDWEPCQNPKFRELLEKKLESETDITRKNVYTEVLELLSQVKPDDYQLLGPVSYIEAKKAHSKLKTPKKNSSPNTMNVKFDPNKPHNN